MSGCGGYGGAKAHSVAAMVKCTRTNMGLHGSCSVYLQDGAICGGISKAGACQ